MSERFSELRILSFQIALSENYFFHMKLEEAGVASTFCVGDFDVPSKNHMNSVIYRNTVDASVAFPCISSMYKSVLDATQHARLRHRYVRSTSEA